MSGRPLSQEKRLGACLGAALETRRAAAGLTRGELARRAGVSANTLMKIEQGCVANPGVFGLDQLAQALRTKVDELVADARRRDRDRHISIVSVGYEGRDLESFITSMREAGVHVVVDVRLNPISRKKGFSKTALGQALADAGIAYVHHRALGNPKENRAAFVDQPAVGKARFRSLLHGTEAKMALADVAERCEQQLVALLCYETDHDRCHRSVVAEEITELCRAKTLVL